MITSNLYKKVLLDPLDKGADELYIVSGYASATFANKHLKESVSSKVNLIIGMPGRRSDHLGFLKLYSEYQNRFRGHYLLGNPPVHSKAYGWFSKKDPLVGFSGSANYSQPGFFEKSQINQVAYEDPSEIKKFYDSLLKRSVEMKDFSFDVKDLNVISPKQIGNSVNAGNIVWEVPEKRVSISFLDRHGELPQRSGLNWGQRPEQNREPNQAYLSLRKDSRKEGFLPNLAETFTLITDDNYSMDCVVAQQGRKAIHSTKDNSEIGKYIRERLNVPLGSPVKVDDLIKYGRTDYTIEKINSETFLFDMSLK